MPPLPEKCISCWIVRVKEYVLSCECLSWIGFVFAYTFWGFVWVVVAVKSTLGAICVHCMATIVWVYPIIWASTISISISMCMYMCISMCWMCIINGFMVIFQILYIFTIYIIVYTWLYIRLYTYDCIYMIVYML